MALHVTPIDDLVPHVRGPGCWCAPTEAEPGLWVHHSADGREADEEDADRLTRLTAASPNGWIDPKNRRVDPKC